MTLYDFYVVVAEVRRQAPELRLGQVFFNELYQRRPHLANIIRGGPADPFATDDPNDTRFRLALDLVERFWYRKDPT